MEKFLEKLPNSRKDYIQSIRKRFGAPQKLSDFNSVILFGAAHLGKHFLRALREKGITVLAFSDNDKKMWGASIEGVPVIPPRAINKQQYSYVLVTSRYVKEICRQLRGLKTRNVIPYYVVEVLLPDISMDDFYPNCFTQIQRGKVRIAKAYNLLSDVKSKRPFLRLLDFMVTLSPERIPPPEPDEYFIRSLALSKNETYVDCGAYDGDTLFEFIKRTKGRFKKYIAFEPDNETFQKFVKAVPSQFSGKIFPLQAAASSRRGYLQFLSADDKLGSMASPKGQYKVKAVMIDDVCSKDKVTFIKMDVEGHEPHVLQGAKKTLKKYKPKLAVCVYHKPAHLWELILQIHKINPAYQKFYLRHHEPGRFQTVLYVK